jgi:hypothetical protein
MKRLLIDRLDLDLHGVSPANAESVVRLLGPALAQAMRGRQIGRSPGQEIDAGRLDASAAPEPGELAARIAQRIADKTSGG